MKRSGADLRGAKLDSVYQQHMDDCLRAPVMEFVVGHERHRNTSLFVFDEPLGFVSTRRLIEIPVAVHRYFAALREPFGPSVVSVFPVENISRRDSMICFN